MKSSIILLDKRGFTLLELLLTASLMSLLIGLLITFMIQSIGAFSLEDDFLTTNQTAELALEFVTSYLRMAYEYELKDNQSTINFTGYYQGTQRDLSFFQYTSGGEPALGFQVNSGVRRPLINGVKEISFSPQGSSIHIILVMDGKNGQEVQVTSWVTPRNR